MARELLLWLHRRIANVLNSKAISIDVVDTLLFCYSEWFWSIVPCLDSCIIVELLNGVNFWLAICLLNWARLMRSNLGWNSALIFYNGCVFLIQQSAWPSRLNRCWSRVGYKRLFDSCFGLRNLAETTVATNTPAHVLAFWWVCDRVSELLMSLWRSTWQGGSGRVKTTQYSIIFEWLGW